MVRPTFGTIGIWAVVDGRQLFRTCGVGGRPGYALYRIGSGRIGTLDRFYSPVTERIYYGICERIGT